MRFRKPPDLIRYIATPKYANKKRVVDARDQLVKDLEGDVHNDQLKAEELLYARVEAVAEDFPELDKYQYGKEAATAYNLTRPVAVAPAVDSPTEDFVTAWSQPEAQGIWNSWGRQIRRAYAAGYQASKGVMLATGGMRGSPHLRHGHELAKTNSQLWGLVTRLSEQAEGSMQVTPRLACYERSTVHVKNLSDGLSVMLMEANIQIVQTIKSEFFPDAPIGRWWAVDGSDDPAWTQQRSSRRKNGTYDPALEARLTKRCPHAGFKVMSRDQNGMFDPRSKDESDGRSRSQITKRWRGYNLIILVEVLTGIPCVGLLVNGSHYEPDYLEGLLDRLFELWPDVPIEAVVGDKAYDVDRLHEMCETRFGVHLVASRQPRWAKTGGIRFKKTGRTGRESHKTVMSVNGVGIARCWRHGISKETNEESPRTLLFAGTEIPTRSGLTPGERVQPTKFRSRFVCRDGCGKVSINMHAAPAALPYYPHNPYGKPRLHAMRLALLGRRNVVEAAFASVKVGYKQALRGSARTRVYDRDTQEGLTWIGFTTRALLLLASLRAS
jgi:hypothetical protein